MDSLFAFVQNHAQAAHWIVFSLLMLAGLNFPISEDLVVILSGVLASTWVPENSWKLFLAVFAGAYLSDWLVYWIGRTWGGRLWETRWFSRLLHPKKLLQIKEYYARYGILTLLIGRFIPFGVRNCLFVTAGMGKMRFWKFLIADGIACLASNTTLFLLAYFGGKGWASVMPYIHLLLFSLFLIALIVFIWYKRAKTHVA